MPDFLNNLIYRHQGRVQTVTPRTRSIFEDASRLARPDMAGDTQSDAILLQDQDVDSKRATVTTLAAQQNTAALAAAKRAARPGRSPGSSDTDAAGRGHRHTGTLANPPDSLREAVRPEPPGSRRTARTESSDGYGQSRDPHPGSASQVSQTSTSTLETNQRIDAVLKRLQAQLNSGTRHEPLSSSQDSAAPVLQDGHTSTHDAGRPDPSGADDRHAATDRNNFQRGDFEIPDWLIKQQAEFGRRHAQIDARPEPVITVTIGRVEVRATREATPKSAAGVSRPAGVMSLDEYLGRRRPNGAV